MFWKSARYRFQCAFAPSIDLSIHSYTSIYVGIYTKKKTHHPHSSVGMLWMGETEIVRNFLLRCIRLDFDFAQTVSSYVVHWALEAYTFVDDDAAAAGGAIAVAVAFCATEHAYLNMLYLISFYLVEHSTRFFIWLSLFRVCLSFCETCESSNKI